MEVNFDLAEKLKQVVIKSYEESKEIGELKIKNKELNDIVTDVDIFMEKKIVSKLQEWFPEHSIYSEEIGELHKDSEYEWLIDPIDGTINFSSGIPMFSTSIALRKNQETIFGFIYDYTQEKCYYAIKDKGAYCDGKKIHVSSNENLSDSVISFCLTSHYNTERINEVLEVEKSLASKVRGLRLIVSAAIELAWCAEGKIDGCINIKSSMGLSSAAGKLLVLEAGGMVSNCKGEKRKNVDTMLVTNGKIHTKLVNALKYTVFIGNITEVIEIGPNFDNEMNIYLAGKAYSQAMASAKTGMNSKLLTVVSGLRKKELEKLYKEIKNNNIDTSYIKVSNDIDNDLKIIIVGNKQEKYRYEDIPKGSAEAFSEDLIMDNEAVIKDAKYVVCQTKINPKATKKLIELSYENKVPVIMTTSRPENISIIENEENKNLLDKVSIIICDKKEFEVIFGKDAILNEYLEKYRNKLIVSLGHNGVVYHDGSNIINIHGTKDQELNSVGAMDVFVGNFVRKLSEENNISKAIEEGICAATARGIYEKYKIPSIEDINKCRKELNVKINII